jgi:hypothetical protein
VDRNWRRGKSIALLRLTGLACTLSLAACSSIPRGLPIAPVRVDEVIAALHCELASIYANDPGTFFYGWAAGAELNLILNNTQSGTPGLTLRPTVSEGKLTTPASATFSDTARRTYKVRDFISLGGLNPQTASGGQVQAHCPVMSPSSERIGVGEFLEAIARADARDGASYIQFDQSNMEVTFNATRTIDGGLTFETSMFTASLNGGKVSRTLENKITITFVKDPSPPPLRAPQGEELFGAGPAPVAAPPSAEAIRQLNSVLDELTEDKGIQLKPGDTLVVE